MRETRDMRVFVSLVAVLMIAVAPAARAQEDVEVIDLLVFTETAGFRHASIPHGVTMLKNLAATETLADVDFTVTEVANSMGDGPVPSAPTVNYVLGQVNPSHAIANQLGNSLFNDENLAKYDVVVWISNTGDVLNDAEQAAFERYIKGGGGYVGIHAAADSDRAWDWYEDLSGGQFRSHPAGTPQATIDVEDGSHASTAHLPARWTRVDEWYNYERNPRSYTCYSDPQQSCSVRVLLRMDETTYSAGTGAMGADHPIAWCNEWGGGRAWYTGLGHTNASYTEPHFVTHVLGGILTAADVDGLAESADFAGSPVDPKVLFSCEPAASAS
jgi:cytochrome c